MPRIGLFLVAASLFSAGCDSNSLSSEVCASIRLIGDGTFSASLSQGAMTPNCFSVSVAEGRTLFIAYEVGDALAGDLRSPLTLTLDGTTEGTYTLDDNSGEDDTDESYAHVGATDRLVPSFATSGVVVVDELTDTRFRGSFNFITSTGLSVSNGRFDIQL